MRSLATDDLELSIFFPDVDFGAFWNVLAEFGIDLLIKVKFISIPKKFISVFLRDIGIIRFLAIVIMSCHVMSIVIM